jgi:MarR family transcriptional regulator, organic hydroperoxide resistance regulator
MGTRGTGAIVSADCEETVDRTDLRRIFRDLRRVHAQLTTAVHVRLRDELGLSLALFESMAVVAQMRCCRVRDLAAELNTSAGGASKAADRLLEAGYCRRSPNPADRRSSLLELTPAGRRVYAEALNVLEQELDGQLAASLSAAQLRELNATLRELRLAGLQLPPRTAVRTGPRQDVPRRRPPRRPG